jgi:hypothetical protein
VAEVNYPDSHIMSIVVDKKSVIALVAPIKNAKKIPKPQVLIWTPGLRGLEHNISAKAIDSLQLSYDAIHDYLELKIGNTII